MIPHNRITAYMMGSSQGWTLFSLLRCGSAAKFFNISSPWQYLQKATVKRSVWEEINYGRWTEVFELFLHLAVGQNQFVRYLYGATCTTIQCLSLFRRFIPVHPTKVLDHSHIDFYLPLLSTCQRQESLYDQLPCESPLPVLVQEGLGTLWS